MTAKIYLIEGADGRAGKCPGCKRALDDDGVECRPTIHNGLNWCAEKKLYYEANGDVAL